MPKLSLRKTIEATKLNKRTGLAERGPDETISFGALVEFVSSERDSVRFSYMGETYRCPEDEWRSATVEVSGASDPTTETSKDAAAANGGNPGKPGLIWEALSSTLPGVARAKVPGGWLVSMSGQSSGLTFLPDSAHEWDGTSPES